MNELATDTPPPKSDGPLGRIKNALKSFRWWMLVPVSVGILILQGLTSPDGFRSPAVWLIWMTNNCIIAAMAHCMRRILFPGSDYSAAWDKAMKGDMPAAILAVGIKLFVAIVFLAMSLYAKAAPDVRTYVPQNAQLLLPQLKEEQMAQWPEHAFPSYFGALIEQESCVSLTNSRCWNPRAQLKTSREEGGGLGQFTRAYDASGALRFDALAEVKALAPTLLADFNWNTVYVRADLSMRAILVKSLECDRRLRQVSPQMSPYDRTAMCDAAYNGGLGGLSSDRKLCALTPGCDPQKWFANVEATSNKSRVKWQGYGKSAFEINREHVSSALLLRRPKYIPALGADL